MFNSTLLIIVAAVLVFIGPYFSILAVNTLFNTGIELNIYTWLSAAWINMLLTSATIKNKG